MRHISAIATILLLLAVGTTTVHAQQERVVEHSRATRPTWIGLTTPAYLAATEVGDTLSEATDKAMNTIRQHIINSVAVNVASAEVMLSREVTYDDWSSIMCDYSSVLMTEAAKLPYLYDISVSNAADIYWERIYTRSTKSYRYEVSIRYPFSEETRRELVDAFIAIDNAKVEEFTRLRDELATIDNLDKVKNAVNALEALKNYFFDATRKDEAEVLLRNYRALYSRVTLNVEEQGEGYCIFAIMLDGRAVITSVGARLRSDSALEMTVRAVENNRYMLTYNPEYASPKDINSIEIIYPFGGISVSKTIYFDAPSR